MKSSFLFITPLTKFYQVSQVTCGHVNVMSMDNECESVSYHILNFTRIRQEKLLVLSGGFGSGSMIWDWHWVSS